MPNPRLANRYAKSIVDLAIEQNQLEVVYADMKYIQAVCIASKEFTTLLKSPVIKADKKIAIIEAVTKGNVSELTNLFNKLLVNKGRESELFEIANAIIDQYNEIKGIHQVTLTTAVEVSDNIKSAIESKIKAEQGLQNVELNTKVDESLIGGFVLEFNNNWVDASIARDLRDVKKQFAKNFYVNQLA
jgi:F-type H+-transporting ATPase subunit delta